MNKSPPTSTSSDVDKNISKHMNVPYHINVGGEAISDSDVHSRDNISDDAYANQMNVPDRIVLCGDAPIDDGLQTPLERFQKQQQNAIVLSTPPSTLTLDRISQRRNEELAQQQRNNIPDILESSQRAYGSPQSTEEGVTLNNKRIIRLQAQVAALEADVENLRTTIYLLWCGIGILVVAASIRNYITKK